MKRFSRRVPLAEADVALLEMLEWFPGGVEQEEDGGSVIFSGYGKTRPAPGLDAQPVADGWEDAWRRFHRPVTVGDIWVGPPWCETPVSDTGVSVMIDPGCAFGTGAHGSTQAALELLQRLPPSPALDIGCGSGVLSVAAARLGFGPVWAVDIDPLAVQATAENAARNGVDVTVALCDALAGALPAAPLWLANLELNPLHRLLRRPDLPPLLLVSGLLESQSLGGAERVVVDGWAAELLRPSG